MISLLLFVYLLWRHDIIRQLWLCSLISIKEKKKLVEKIPHGRENERNKIPFYPFVYFSCKISVSASELVPIKTIFVHESNVQMVFI